MEANLLDCPATVLKCIIIGDQRTGKSCLQLRFTQNSFRCRHDVTIGVEFAMRIIAISGQQIKVHIWDTAGQENFRAITRAYYRRAAFCLVLYDITDPDSFAHVLEWIHEAREHAPSDVVIALVGNKQDLGKQRRVSHLQGQALAHANHVMFFETSGKTGQGVEEVFVACIRCCSDHLILPPPGLRVSTTAGGSATACC